MKAKFLTFSSDTASGEKDDVMQALFDDFLKQMGAYGTYFNAFGGRARIWTSKETNDVVMTITQFQNAVYDFKVCWKVKNEEYLSPKPDMKNTLSMKFKGNWKSLFNAPVLLAPQVGEDSCKVVSPTRKQWDDYFKFKILNTRSPRLTFTMKSGEKVLDELTIVPKVFFNLKKYQRSFTKYADHMLKVGKINEVLHYYALSYAHSFLVDVGSPSGNPLDF